MIKFVTFVRKYSYMLIIAGFLIILVSNLLTYLNSIVFAPSMFLGFTWLITTRETIKSSASINSTTGITSLNFQPQAICSAIFCILALISFVVLFIIYKRKFAYLFCSMPFLFSMLSVLLLEDINYWGFDKEFGIFFIHILLFLISIAYTVLVAYTERQVEELKNNQK